MLAIFTKKLKPTTHRGDRVKAWCYRGSVTIAYQYNGKDKDHHDAMRALCKKMGWKDLMFVVGDNADGRGFVYVECGRRGEVVTL